MYPSGCMGDDYERFLREWIRKLVDACIAADYLIASLLAVREGTQRVPADELLLEVQAAVRAAAMFSNADELERRKGVDDGTGIVD